MLRGGIDNPNFKGLNRDQSRIFKLLLEDKLPVAKGSKGPGGRYKGKKWEELTNVQRQNFKHQIYPYYKNLLSKTKGMMTEDDILKLLSDKFGETVSVGSLRGRSGVDSLKFQSKFGQVVKKILKPYDFTKKQKFYKIPTENEINKLKEAYDLRFSQTDTLRPNTVKNISILHDKFKDVYKQGILPDATEVLKKLPDGTTGSQAGNATIRLAQIYAGKNFDLSFKGIDQKFANKINNIKINNPTSKKMFEQISKRKFGDPYLDQFYRINLQMIDEKLGNKTGTFESLKDQAKTILQKNKIPIYDGRAKNPYGFNINEIVGVSGSASSKAAEFSQFVDVMEGNLNQNVLTGYQSQLSKVRSKIEANPSLFETEAAKINERALDLEKQYDVKLARLRPAEDVTKVFSPERLQQLKDQGLDIEAASKRAGYTFELPEKTATVSEFVSSPEKFLPTIKKKLKNIVKGAPTSCQLVMAQATGGRVPADCLAAIDQDPIGSAQKIANVEATSGPLAKAKNAVMGVLKSGGFKTFGAAGLAGGAAAALVKEFRNDDPTTYLSNEDQQKSMLVDMVTQPISEDFQRPDILDYQLPAVGASLAASTALGAPSTIKASRSRGLGVERKGLIRTSGRVLGRGLGIAASPALLAPFAAGDIASQISEGDSVADIATNPINYTYPLFAEQTDKLTKGLNPTFRKFARLGLGRAALKGLSRAGIGGLAASLAIQGVGLLDD
jgi:hypothetical protein